MILIGDSRFAPLGMDGWVCYNYSSPIETIEKLHLMPPMFNWKSELDFDIWYANWLLTDQLAFYDLMKMMYAVYAGFDVYLCASALEAFQPINESFIKFIQQRYGINCFIINEAEDMMYANDNGSGFTIEGIANFDIDKERLTINAIESIMQDPKNTAYGFVMEGAGRI